MCKELYYILMEEYQEKNLIELYELIEDFFMKKKCSKAYELFKRKGDFYKSQEIFLEEIEEYFEYSP